MDPSWERAHPGQPERWSFDFFVDDGSMAGCCTLVLRPGPAGAWYWALLVGEGRPYVLVRELDVPAPRSPGSRQVRAEALWADMNCETPFEHWSVGLEAFGVAMEDPDEALRGERGDRTGLGFDLEWEATGLAVGGEGAYDQPCAVHGQVLVGGGSGVETIDLEGHGWRRHAWGMLPCLEPGWSWLAGRLDGAPHRAEGAGREAVQPLLRAPLALTGTSVLERQLVRFPTAAGPKGLGWGEWVVTAPDEGGRPA